MDMSDDLAVGRQKLDRVGATEQGMPGIEAHTHQRRVQGIEYGVDLSTALDVAASVEMQDRIEASRQTDLSRSMDIVDERAEALGWQAGLGVVRDLDQPTPSAPAPARRPRARPLG